MFICLLLYFLFHFGKFDDDVKKLSSLQNSEETALKLQRIKMKEDEGFQLLYGVYSDENITRAVQIFKELKSYGSPLAQLALFLLHGIGVGVEQDYKVSHTYCHFSSLGNDPISSLSMAIKYYYGFNVKKSCDEAVSYLRGHALAAISSHKILTSFPSKSLFPDEGFSNLNVLTENSDVIVYLHQMAMQGDVKSAINLGQMYMYGFKSLNENLEKAFFYFETAARYGSIEAESYLGLVCIKNEKFAPHYEIARKHLNSAAQKKSPVAYFGLGLVYLYGYGEEVNYSKAFLMFSMAIEGNVIDASPYIGYLYFQGLGVQKNFAMALKYFLILSGKGSIGATKSLRSMYYIGLMADHGLAMLPSCDTSFDMYRSVVEKFYLKDLLKQAIVDFSQRDFNSSLLKYLFLAEIGTDVGLLNAASLLSWEKSNIFSKSEQKKKAFALWERASKQGIATAHLNMGDSLYYGLGTQINYEKAFNHYRAAMELQKHPRAIFNVAYMYQNGIGTRKDIYMAKRYYDMNLEINPSSFLPATFALAFLRIAIFFHQMKEITFSFRNASLSSLIAILTSGNNDLLIIAILFGLLLIMCGVYFMMWNTHQLQTEEISSLQANL